MRKPFIYVASALPPDDKDVLKFFQAQLPLLPDAYAAFWPDDFIPKLLTGVEWSKSWFASARGKVIGVASFRHSHGGLWQAFLLCDPAWAPRALHQLHTALLKGITQSYQEQWQPSSRISVNQVTAIVPESPHQKMLETFYEEQGWTVYLENWKVELAVSKLNRAQLAAAQTEVRTAGVDIQPLHHWPIREQTTEVKRLIAGAGYQNGAVWVAFFNGRAVAVNGWRAMHNGAGILLGTHPLWLVDMDHDVRVKRGLVAEALLTLQTPQTQGVVFHTQQ
ncbi:hypothetical protein K7W42_22710, partial [Deinococcus sp. HMF7604]|uniref:hypothetical protein n=1 Tax=Deinococcus betulae TaxID=2873312 RepID=UPI001CCBBE55